MRLKKIMFVYFIEYYLKRYKLNVEKFLSNDDFLKYKIFEYTKDAISNKFIIYYKYTL